jgi:hypothetical protein
LSNVNPVRNSSGVLNAAGIIIKSNPAAEQWGIISNGVKSRLLSSIRFALIREKGVERSLKKSQRLDNIWKPKYYSLQRG